jgi:hypothetical protein
MSKFLPIPHVEGKYLKRHMHFLPSSFLAPSAPLFLGHWVRRYSSFYTERRKGRGERGRTVAILAVCTGGEGDDSKNKRGPLLKYSLSTHSFSLSIPAQ